MHSVATPRQVALLQHSSCCQGGRTTGHPDNQHGGLCQKFPRLKPGPTATTAERVPPSVFSHTRRAHTTSQSRSQVREHAPDACRGEGWGHQRETPGSRTGHATCRDRTAKNSALGPNTRDIPKPRKRAYQRALLRARARGHTFYRGGIVTLQELEQQYVSQHTVSTKPAPAARPYPPEPHTAMPLLRYARSAGIAQGSELYRMSCIHGWTHKTYISPACKKHSFGTTLITPAAVGPA